MINISTKDYKSPSIDYGEYIPAIFCDSFVDGGTEDLTDENWDF